MIDLPRSLSPWATLLDLFPHDLAVGALGPLVRSLGRLVGPPRVRPNAGSGEPDGFSGLNRRGSYERLLLSEWLLAEEVPEEFVRRAAMNEHAFYQLARKEPGSTRFSFVLFDAGPDQWGTPRIAQIAALVVLSRRAEAGGLRLVWGIAQTAPTKVMAYETVTPALVEKLLQARNPLPASETDIAGWRAYWEDLVSDGKGNVKEAVRDAWLVGSERFADLPGAKPLSRLVFTDAQDKDPLSLLHDVNAPRRIIAIVRAAGDSFAGRGEVSLPLPPERQCVRLLRDPFDSQTNTPLRTGKDKIDKLIPASNLVWTANGTKLLARASDGALIVYPIPNSPRAGAGQPKRYTTQSGRVLLAAGRVRKMIVTVCRTQAGKLVVSGLGGGWYELQGEYDFAFGSLSKMDTTQVPLGSCFGIGNDLYATVPYLDKDGVVRMSLLYFWQDKNERKVAGVHDTLVGAFAVDEGFAYISNDSKTSPKLRVRQGKTARRDFVVAHEIVDCILVGPSGDARKGLVAAQTANGNWNLGLVEWSKDFVEPVRTVGLSADAGEAVGVYATGDRSFFVTLRPDRTKFSRYLAGSDVPQGDPHYTGSLVTYAAMNGAGALALLAYATEAGEVAVYSLTHRDFVFRMVPKETPTTPPALSLLPNLEVAKMDELTGLMTKFALREKLGELAPPYTLIAFELEDFDAYNHHIGDGDTILKSVGDYLKGWIEGTGRLAARVGESSFLLVLPHKVQARAGESYATTLQTNLKTRCIDNMPLHVLLGLARAPENGFTPEQMLKAVNEALTQAGKNKSKIHVA